VLGRPQLQPVPSLERDATVGRGRRQRQTTRKSSHFDRTSRCTRRKHLFVEILDHLIDLSRRRCRVPEDLDQSRLFPRDVACLIICFASCVVGAVSSKTTAAETTTTWEWKLPTVCLHGAESLPSAEVTCLETAVTGRALSSRGVDAGIERDALETKSFRVQIHKRKDSGDSCPTGPGTGLVRPEEERLRGTTTAIGASRAEDP
jgi:hypothetical protein